MEHALWTGTMKVESDPAIEAGRLQNIVLSTMQPIHIRCGHLSVNHRCSHSPLASGGGSNSKAQLHRVDHHRGRSRRRGRQPGAAALRHDFHGHDKP